ncbi:MAG: hypothetical protein M3R65_01575 [Gemmatimonadota bacterium]|nr:hypothetical protein [Gemmatimonadota bacterium]
MDPRRVAYTLTRITSLLELSGVDRFRARAYRGAAAAIRSLATDDVTPLLRSGELARLPGVGPATLSVIAELVETGDSSYLTRLLERVPEGLVQVASVPGLTAAKEVTAELRRGDNVVNDIVLVAECTADPTDVLRDIANAPDVVESVTQGATMHLRFVDETRISLSCTGRESYSMRLWRETGNASHVEAVVAHAALQGVTLHDDSATDSRGATVLIAAEADIYAAAGLPFIVPELREGLGEIEAAERGELPRLITRDRARRPLAERPGAHVVWRHTRPKGVAVGPRCPEHAIGERDRSDRPRAAMTVGRLNEVPRAVVQTGSRSRCRLRVLRLDTQT